MMVKAQEPKNSVADYTLPDGLVISHIASIEQLESWLPSLSELLHSCVNLNPEASSIGFRAPLSRNDAAAYWNSLLPDIVGPDPMVSLFVLQDSATKAHEGKGTAIGTFQLAQSPKATHVHKTEVRKLLVRSEQRGNGLGRQLMEFAKKFARDQLCKTMILLDTATDTPARGFYLNLGYVEWGVCPAYAQNAAGRLHDSSFFLKILGPTEEAISIAK